jgi:hypothetical protein
MTCELYACDTPVAAVLVTPAGNRLQVCGPHGRTLADRGYQVFKDDREVSPDEQ